MACYLVIQTRAQCPTGCSCIGSTELVCIGAGLTEVPDFSASIRQTTTDLYECVLVTGTTMIIHGLLQGPGEQSHHFH